MKKLLIILLIIPSLGMAQGFESLDFTIGEFFKALGESNYENRTKKLEQVFSPTGKITSVNHSTQPSPNVISGNVSSFLEGSKAMYENYKVYNDEVSREVEYYGDIASVNSLVYQTLAANSTGKKYAQNYWMQIELAFVKDRWFITYVSWANQYNGIPVENALLTDTIWHQP